MTQLRSERRAEIERSYLSDLCLDREIDMKEGARVMLKYNVAPKMGLYNGTLGKILKLDQHYADFEYTNQQGRICTVQVSNRAAFHERHVDHNKRWTYQLYHFPFTLAYATTIHKAQGLTLDKARLDLSRTFSVHQAYVGLSRVRKLENLQLCQRQNLASKFKVDPAVVEFYNEYIQKNKKKV